MKCMFDEGMIVLGAEFADKIDAIKAAGDILLKKDVFKQNILMQ